MAGLVVLSGMAVPLSMWASYRLLGAKAISAYVPTTLYFSMYSKTLGFGHLPDILQHLVRQRIYTSPTRVQRLEYLLHSGTERGIVHLVSLYYELGWVEPRPEHGLVGQELGGPANAP